MFMNDLRHQREGEVVRDLPSREEKWFMHQLASTFAYIRGGSKSLNTFRRVCSSSRIMVYSWLGFERGARYLEHDRESPPCAL